MKIKVLPIILLCLFICSTVACGGSRPSSKSAQKIARSHFKSYGKQFNNTPFANSNVDSITVNAIEPVSNKVVNTDTIIHFSDGRLARTLLRMEHRFPTGWRVTSWEVLGAQ